MESNFNPTFITWYWQNITHTRIHARTHTHKEWTRRYKKKERSKLCSSRKFQSTNQYRYSWLIHQVFLCKWKAKWKGRTLCCSNLLTAYRPWKSAFKILAFTWMVKKKQKKTQPNIFYCLPQGFTNGAPIED